MQKTLSEKLRDVIRSQRSLEPIARAKGMQRYHFYAFGDPPSYPRVNLSRHHLAKIARLIGVTLAAAQRDYLDRGGVLAGERKKRSAA